MKSKMVALPLSVLVLSIASIASGDLATEYTNFAALDEDANIELYWSINSSESMMYFAVQAKTTGWVGFGISSGQGKMKGADIVIGWVKDGKPFFAVRSVCRSLCELYISTCAVMKAVLTKRGKRRHVVSSQEPILYRASTFYMKDKLLCSNI